MPLLDITFPASYKGVNFLVDSTTTQGGIKNVKHVYPNSNNQVIEPLGVKQKSYPIRAFINNDPEIDDYEIKRDTLVAALDDQQSGLLIHPFLGHIENVIATEWSLIEDFSEFGKAKFSIVFEVSLAQSVPEVASNTISQVRNFQEAVSDSVTNDISDNFLITFSSNINDSIDQVNGIIQEINVNANLFSIADDQLNTFNNQVGQLSANVANLVRDPEALSLSLSNVFNTISGMYVTVEAAFGVMANFFNFGENDIPIDTSTRSNIERKKNRQLLND
jgi:prophage DNA circulation protein